MEGPDTACGGLGRQIHPLRYGRLGLHMQSNEVSNAAIVDGAGQAARNLKGRPAVPCPLQGASGALVRERWTNLHKRYVELCKRDAGAKDLPTEFLDRKNGPLKVQQLVTRKRSMPSLRGSCNVASLRSWGLPESHPGRPHDTGPRHVSCVYVCPPGAPCCH